MELFIAGLSATAAYNSLAAFSVHLEIQNLRCIFPDHFGGDQCKFLDILFIVKIGMGVEGCAYATAVIALANSDVWSCCLDPILSKGPPSILHLKKEI